jgi:GC-rich sequence DNA-binding factor
MFLKAVLGVFQNTVNGLRTSQDPFLALDKPPFHPGAIAARKRLLSRQEKVMTNILCWRRYTNSLIGIDEVARNLLVNCILPVAKTGWEVGGEECVHRVSSSGPKCCMSAENFSHIGRSTIAK